MRVSSVRKPNRQLGAREKTAGHGLSYLFLNLKTDITGIACFHTVRMYVHTFPFIHHVRVPWWKYL